MHARCLRTAYERAQITWPELALDELAFAGHLQVLGWWTAMPRHVAEVYLACACARGDEAACRLFDRTYADILRDTIKGVCRETDRVEEYLQAVREKLLVGPAPGLLKYSGRAPLEAWLRLVAKRVAMDAERAARRRARRDARAEAAADRSSGIESDLDRLRYGAVLQAALANALSGLTQRERRVLRLHYVSGVGVDALGRAFGVHRATAARWIERSRRRLRERMRQCLDEAAGGLSEEELRGLVRLVGSRLELRIPGWDSEIDRG
jgi:RNA polymerase sigma-70 factor (ECF subfamily)